MQLRPMLATCRFLLTRGQFMNRILCLFNRHRPPGRRAEWDGSTFVSRCKRCRKPIRRVGKHKWRRDGQAENT